MLTLQQFLQRKDAETNQNHRIDGGGGGGGGREGCLRIKALLLGLSKNDHTLDMMRIREQHARKKIKLKSYDSLLASTIFIYLN